MARKLELTKKSRILCQTVISDLFKTAEIRNKIVLLQFNKIGRGRSRRITQREKEKDWERVRDR